MRPKTLIHLMLVVFWVGGCSTEQIVVNMSLSLVEGQVRSIQEENDLVLAERAIPASLKMMEGLLQSDPADVRASAIEPHLHRALCVHGEPRLGQRQDQDSTGGRRRDHGAGSGVALSGQQQTSHHQMTGKLR